MEQVGYVRRVINNTAEVEVRRISGCGGGCSSCGGTCNAPSIIVSIENSINAKQGDFIEIKAKPKNIIKYALIVYMIPFIMLVVGMSLGVKWFQIKGIDNYEIYGFLIGILFLVISFIILKLIDKRIKNKDEAAIEMVKILG